MGCFNPCTEHLGQTRPVPVAWGCSRRGCGHTTEIKAPAWFLPETQEGSARIPMCTAGEFEENANNEGKSMVCIRRERFSPKKESGGECVLNPSHLYGNLLRGLPLGRVICLLSNQTYQELHVWPGLIKGKCWVATLAWDPEHIGSQRKFWVNDGSVRLYLPKVPLPLLCLPRALS